MVELLLFAQRSQPTPYERMVAAVRSYHAVSGVLRGVAFGKESTIRFRFLAPDCLDVQGDELGGRYLSDGTDAWSVTEAPRLYYRIDPRQALLYAQAVFGYDLLLDALRGVPAPRPKEPIPPSSQAFDLPIPPGSERYTRYPGQMVVEFDPHTWLPTEMRAPLGAGTYRFESIRLDPPLTRASFQFVPSRGFQESDPHVVRYPEPLSLPMFAQARAKF